MVPCCIRSCCFLVDSKPLRAERNTLLLEKYSERAFMVCLRFATLTTLWGRYFRPHFTEGETETQRSCEAHQGHSESTQGHSEAQPY